MKCSTSVHYYCYVLAVRACDKYSPKPNLQYFIACDLYHNWREKKKGGEKKKEKKVPTPLPTVTLPSH